MAVPAWVTVPGFPPEKPAAVELKLARRDYEGTVAAARARGAEQRALVRPYVADFEYLEGEAQRLHGKFDAAAEALSRRARLRRHSVAGASWADSHLTCVRGRRPGT